MKKELIIGCFLVVMLAAAFINIHYLNSLTDDLVSLIEQAEESVHKSDWDTAEKKAKKAEELWLESDTYTHLVLRHSEIEAATDALYGFLEQIYAREEGALKGAARAACSRLHSIANIEKIRLGSIF